MIQRTKLVDLLPTVTSKNVAQRNREAEETQKVTQNTVETPRDTEEKDEGIGKMHEARFPESDEIARESEVVRVEAEREIISLRSVSKQIN